MRILAVDVGTGTQDILYYDTENTIENAFKLVMPSPTVMVANAIRHATTEGRPVLFHGVMMGGGPCSWAATNHIAAGLPFYATSRAGQTFDDNLENVARQGVRLVGEDDVPALDRLIVIDSRDLDLARIMSAFSSFGVTEPPDVVCVAVFDHGNAPPDVSDRRFRFEYLRDHVRSLRDLRALAHTQQDIPERLTRFKAVADSFAEAVGAAQGSGSGPALVVMDTAAAAIVGALEDPVVATARSKLVVNIGNFHCLAFHLVGDRVAGLFEHHTGELSARELEEYLRKLAAGTLTNEEIFADSGHGALVFDPAAPEPDLVAVTGPRRKLLHGSVLQPYFAVPHGDMMLSGCFGLVRAAALRLDFELPI